MKDLALLVPEFYFDLIARILPGGCACLFFFYPWHDISYIPETTFGFFSATGIFYVIGFIIDLLGDFIFSYFSVRERERRNIVQKVQNHFSDRKDLFLYSRFLKMCAELVMLRSLAIICLGLSFISVFFPVSKESAWYLSLLPLSAFVAFVVILVSFMYFEECIRARYEAARKKGLISLEHKT
mgnify:CR=1 FL=1